jgi:iron(III) transport system ATP-binding protein
MPELVVDDLHLRYGAVEVLKGASLTVERGRIAALLGPSGSGKTTLLRAIAGLERASSGRITISGRTVYDGGSRTDLPAEERGLGFVFQSYALWPNRTVFENAAYGLKLRRKPQAEIKRRVEAVLEVLGLAGLGGRYPHQLSGGQQQRVAIARSLVYEPAVILLDEPLSNLDAKLRDEARAFLKELIAREERAAVMVTHDQVEALAVADTIVLLNGGVIEQEGSPTDLYTRPRTLFTADFIGNNVRLAGRVVSVDGPMATIDVGVGQVVGQAMRPGLAAGESATAICRLDRIGLTSTPGPNRIAMERSTSMFLGERWEHLYRAGTLAIRVLTRDAVTETSSLVEVPQDSLWIF